MLNIYQQEVDDSKNMHISYIGATIMQSPLTTKAIHTTRAMHKKINLPQRNYNKC